MTSKLTITLTIIVAIAIAAFCLRSAHTANKQSEQILADFKRIDSSITTSNSSTKLIAPDTTNILYVKANKILTIVDSIKVGLENVTNKDFPVSFSSMDKERFKRLKFYLADFNSYIRKTFAQRTDIDIDDFVEVSDHIYNNKHKVWESYFFENTDFYATWTLLSFIKIKVTDLEQKLNKQN